MSSNLPRTLSVACLKIKKNSPRTDSLHHFSVPVLSLFNTHIMKMQRAKPRARCDHTDYAEIIPFLPQKRAPQIKQKMNNPALAEILNPHVSHSAGNTAAFSNLASELKKKNYCLKFTSLKVRKLPAVIWNVEAHKQPLPLLWHITDPRKSLRQ